MGEAAKGFFYAELGSVLLNTRLVLHDKSITADDLPAFHGPAAALWLWAGRADAVFCRSLDPRQWDALAALGAVHVVSTDGRNRRLQLITAAGA